MTAKDARAVMLERFGPDIVPLELETTATPIDTGRRARFVATLSVLIEWLLAHPEIPVPTALTFHAEVATLAELEALAEACGTEVYGEPPQLTIFPVGQPHRAPAGVYAPFTVTVHRPDRPFT